MTVLLWFRREDVKVNGVPAMQPEEEKEAEVEEGGQAEAAKPQVCGLLERRVAGPWSWEGFEPARLMGKSSCGMLGGALGGGGLTR